MSVLGLASGARDRLEGLRRGLRVAGRQALSGARLDDHHADRVGDDVVQLGSDPGALVAHRQRRVGLPLLLELARAFGELGGDPFALAQRPARPPPAAVMRRAGHPSSSASSTSSSQAPTRASRAARPPQRALPAPGAECVRGDEEDRPQGRSSDFSGAISRAPPPPPPTRRGGGGGRCRARRRGCAAPAALRAP